MSRIDTLYEAAQKATPGPWRVASPDVRCVLPHYPHGQGQCEYTFQGWHEPAPEYEVGADVSSEATKDVVVSAMGEMSRNVSRDDASFIALADPQTVMALVEVYRAAIPTAHAMHYIALDEKPAIAIGRNHSEGCDLCAAIEKVEALG